MGSTRWPFLQAAFTPLHETLSSQVPLAPLPPPRAPPQHPLRKPPCDEIPGGCSERAASMSRRPRGGEGDERAASASRGVGSGTRGSECSLVGGPPTCPLLPLRNTVPVFSPHLP